MMIGKRFISKGYRVLRFWNHEVTNSQDDGLFDLIEVIEDNQLPPPASPISTSEMGEELRIPHFNERNGGGKEETSFKLAKRGRVFRLT
jgi:hypothetical protein